MKEIIEKIKKGRYIHFIKRLEPNKNKMAVNVELLNNLNCFYKPGYEFKSISIDKEEKIKEFISLIEDGFIEAFCIIE